MFDGIFKVFENELINITCRRTGNILFGRSGKQRNISKHTYKDRSKEYHEWHVLLPSLVLVP